MLGILSRTVQLVLFALLFGFAATAAGAYPNKNIHELGFHEANQDLLELFTGYSSDLKQCIEKAQDLEAFTRQIKQSCKETAHKALVLDNMVSDPKGFYHFILERDLNNDLELGRQFAERKGEAYETYLDMEHIRGVVRKRLMMFRMAAQ